MKWKNVDINVDDPNVVLNIYSSRLYELDDWEQLSQKQGQNIFVHIVSDYYDYGLSLDVLIKIAESMSDKWRQQSDTEFEDILVTLADLDYALRNITNEDRSGSNLVGVLRDLYNYFEKHKDQISNK